MLTNLSRPEEICIKNDIHEIAKSLAAIASSVPNTATEKTESSVNNVDPFFGKIHMSQEHMDNFCKDYHSNDNRLVNLMEECAELQQAASKMYRNREYNPHKNVWYGETKDNFVEELAHVLIDIRMICHTFNIEPEEIQQEIFKKYPEGYRKEN